MNARRTKRVYRFTNPVKTTENGRGRPRRARARSVRSLKGSLFNSFEIQIKSHTSPAELNNKSFADGQMNRGASRGPADGLRRAPAGRRRRARPPLLSHACQALL
ncbi:hypothetical protein EVAR_30834_1 [Eumeta japonica]|uniref:Uncharacterized protein n=1 Tax=Eumeta variegata TaxID=151549 RepID=A0A4C1XPD3_EUMVA|nr:hypothetical protein EVAR_30834_1 [Eumeta japonica]